MNITITGATGLLGSHLVNELTRYHVDVQALRRLGTQPRIRLEREPVWIDGELDDLTEASLKATDCLFHLAAHGVDPATANWEDAFRVNVTDSLGLWLRAANAGVRNFLICGSCFEYGSAGEQYEFIPPDAPLCPTGPYHASKAAATMAASALAHSENVKVWVLRPFHIFGDGESANRLYPQILQAARTGNDLDLTEGNQIRDFMHVQDTARLLHGYSLLLREVTQTNYFRVSNLGTGYPCSLREFAEKIWSQQGGTGRLNFGALPYRQDEVMRYVPQIDKAEQSAAINALSRVAEI